MGCDIHMRAEIKKKWKNPKVEPEWVAVGRVFESSYYDPKEIPTITKYSKSDEEYESNEKFTVEPYDGRNYDLFAILANVRNGYGFAGVDTGDGFKPIAMPKGVPNDASKYYKLLVKQWDGDGHAHSYFTLDELEKYDWNQKTIRRGVVDFKEYKVFKKKGRPNNWSGAVIGQNVKNVSNKEMEKVKEDPNRSYFTQVSWILTYKEAVGSFFTKTIPQLRKLSKNKDVLDIRILFFFDN